MNKHNCISSFVVIALVSCLLLCGCEAVFINIEMNKTYENEMTGGNLDLSAEVLQDKEIGITQSISKTGEEKNFAERVFNSVLDALKSYYENKIP